MRISVAMATCNGAAHLHEQLQSIAHQSHAPSELIVSDDASDDDTLTLLRAFVTEAPFPVTILENTARRGVAGNFARAIEGCSGDWIALCDQDDVWMPDKLAALAVAAGGPEVCLVFSNALLCDVSGRAIGGTQWGRLGFGAGARRLFGRDSFDALLRFNVVTGMTMMLCASLRELVLPVPDGWVHDEWVALLAAAVGGVGLVDRPLVRYRQHATQQIGGVAGGLPGQLRHARAHMDADYMRRAADRSRLASERLGSAAVVLRRPDASRLLRERAEHYDRRVKPNARTVLRDWRGGDYRRFGYGWKGVVQDLLLR